MSTSIAVFGAGPGLGQAVARRYALEFGFLRRGMEKGLRPWSSGSTDKPARPRRTDP